jgi:SAM-dependent methyltransferase
MDVRTSTHPVVAGLRDGLDTFNRRHPWSHNDHFHGWILRNLPVRRGRALDIGCGRGALLERLALQFARVEGIDVDDAMATIASTRVAPYPHASVRRRGFAELTPADDGPYDLITMVAVLHHLDLDATLSRIPGLLAPGGRFLVVGLTRLHSPTDLLIDGLSALANPLVGLVKHPRPVRTEAGPAGDVPAMPVKDPTRTWDEVVGATRTHLPGGVARRRLFFRHTLRWQKPEPG